MFSAIASAVSAAPRVSMRMGRRLTHRRNLAQPVGRERRWPDSLIYVSLSRLGCTGRCWLERLCLVYLFRSCETQGSRSDTGVSRTMLIYITPSTARKLHSVLLNVVMRFVTPSITSTLGMPLVKPTLTMTDRAPQSFFSTTDSGSILIRFSQDMTLIEWQLPTAVLVTISSA